MSDVRVLHVITTAQRRGAEMFVFDLIGALSDDGLQHRVAILSDREPLALAYQAPTHLLGARGRLIPGVRIDTRTLQHLRWLIAAHRPHLVHAHGGEPLKYSVLAGLRNTPLLYRRIGIAPDSIRRGLARRLHGRLMRRSDRVVAVAEAVRRETIDTFGVPAGKVVTIPRGIDARRLNPVKGRAETRRSLGIASDAPVILSLGALSWEKDPLAHVRVTDRVAAQVPEVVHLMAGDGPLRGQVEAEARRRDGRVIILGSRPDIADLLVASDMMLLASRIEGMPGCLIEGGMAGVPAAAYAVAGVSEIVVNGETGHLVRFGDFEGLVGAVLNLVGDVRGREAMGALARERCRSMFDIGAIAARYRIEYRELAG